MRTRILLALTAAARWRLAAGRADPDAAAQTTRADRAASDDDASRRPPPPAPKPQAPAAGGAGRARLDGIAVTDLGGRGRSRRARRALTGPVAREGTTARDGTLRFQTLRAGTYRLRLESPEFVTLRA